MISRQKITSEDELDVFNDGRTVLAEVDVDPLGDLMLNFLVERDKEEAYVDFKETLSIKKDAPFAKIAKDIFAFSNYGGGFILIGFRERQKSPVVGSQPEERRNFLPVGLPEEFHVDPADLQTKFNAYSVSPISLRYSEFYRTIDHSKRRFAAIYVQPSTSLLRPVKNGVYMDAKGKSHKAFTVGSVLFRRGTQSVPATREEIAWINRRIEKEVYRLSVLSGQPDQIQEPLYSNLFEVTQAPKELWVAAIKQMDSNRKEQSGPIPDTVVYVPWGNRIVTFNNISMPSSPLWRMIEPSSVQKEELSAWLDDSDKERVIIWLLNKELAFLAKRLGLLHEYKKQKFYYACDGEYRIESWVPRFRRSSELKVTQRIWAQQLRRFIFWHLAVIARFIYSGGNLYLRLTPTIQLTEDGRKAIFGEKEGTVITRLIYNRYNSSYLNSLLFWISRFVEGKESITMAEGMIHVSGKPVECSINVGILSDRPTAEAVQETPEIQVEEENV